MVARVVRERTEGKTAYAIARDLNSPGGRSSEMISAGCSHANHKVLTDVTDTALCESLRLHLVELGLGDRSRVEKLFGRRDLIGARAATARGDD